jgi:hypothetical protein
MSTFKALGFKAPLPGAILSLPQLQKNEKPENGLAGRPFQGFSLKTKGYVEKCPSPTTFSAEVKLLFFRGVKKTLHSLLR